MEGAVILMVALYLIQSILVGELKIKKSPLYLPIFLYTGLMVIYYFFSKHRAVAQPELVRILLSSAVLIVLANSILRVRDLRLLIWVWTISCTIIGLYGLGQRAGGFWIFDIPFFARPAATFGNPNFYATYLVVSIALVMGLLFCLKRFGKILLLPTLIILVLNLYFTKTRGAWIAFIIILLCFPLVYLYLAGANKGSIRIWKILLVLILLGLAIFSIYHKDIWVRQTQRLLIWRDTLVMCIKRPLGVGIGAYHIHFPQFASRGLLEILPQGKFIVNYAHNEPLQVWAETGILGFGLFLWIILSFFFRGFGSLRRDSRNEVALIGGLIFASIGVLVHSLFSVNMRFIVSSIYLFLFMGLVISQTDSDILSLRFKRLFYPIRVILVLIIILSSLFLINSFRAPFRAVHRLEAETDFFDEEVVEPAEQIARIERYIRDNPSNFEAHFKLGWIYAKGIKKKKDGKEYIDQNAVEKAISNFEAASRINPTHSGIYNNLGNIYYTIGNRKSAIESYKKAIEVNPKDANAHFNLGFVYFNIGLMKEAAKEFQTVLDLDPKNHKAAIMIEKMVQ